MGPILGQFVFHSSECGVRPAAIAHVNVKYVAPGAVPKGTEERCLWRTSLFSPQASPVLLVSQLLEPDPLSLKKMTSMEPLGLVPYMFISSLPPGFSAEGKDRVHSLICSPCISCPSPLCQIVFWAWEMP